jgi:2-hydroxy-3-keto-5-methylthiopentenyl-1-phosphate phosphatase
MIRSLVPLPTNARVWIDFDGTITQQDVLDELITRYAIDDSWKSIEARWQTGSIGSGECLTGQLAAVRISDSQIETFLASIQLDPGLTTLMNLLHKHHVPTTVLSDGLDRFIGPLLARAGLGDLAFRSNTFDRQDDRLILRCPHASETCESASAHCKCQSMRNLSDSRVGGRFEPPSRVAEATSPLGRFSPRSGLDLYNHIYIGDGRSDLCPSRKVQCRFAKGVLATNLQREGIEFLFYENLSEVAGILATVWD